MVKIVIDAGHGGNDAGATGNGLLEKNLTLDIVERIASKLKNDYEGVETLLTRNTDVFVGLSERANIANQAKADIFVSVHINSATDPSAKGFESHMYNGTSDPKTIAFQNVMHESIFNAIKSAGIEDRGKKKSNFAVVRESAMVALLTENLFISSPSDASKLSKPDFLDTVAQGHVDGLEKFLGLKKSKQPPRTTSTKLYKVQVGAFSDPDNAERLFKDLLSKGYSAYIIEE